MSLVYQTIRRFVIDPNLDAPTARNYISHVDIIRGDLVDYLFAKVRRAEIKIVRSERLGIDIDIKFLIAPNIEIILGYHSKKSNKIILYDFDNNYNVPIIYQKLLLDKLPLQVRNVVLYYLYPNKHNDSSVEDINMIDGWKINNRWENVTNFVFSLIEVLNKSRYDGSLKYDINLDLNVCKEMCREDEETIIINKKFKH